jgi:hypothetical protein
MQLVVEMYSSRASLSKASLILPSRLKECALFLDVTWEDYYFV